MALHIPSSDAAAATLTLILEEKWQCPKKNTLEGKFTLVVTSVLRQKIDVIVFGQCRIVIGGTKNINCSYCMFLSFFCILVNTM